MDRVSCEETSMGDFCDMICTPNIPDFSVVLQGGISLYREGLLNHKMHMMNRNCICLLSCHFCYQLQLQFLPVDCMYACFTSIFLNVVAYIGTQLDGKTAREKFVRNLRLFNLRLLSPLHT